VNSKILTNGFHKFEENLSRDKSMHIERLKDISTTLFHVPTKVMIETNPTRAHHKNVTAANRTTPSRIIQTEFYFTNSG
jgi:hypothetical protein